MKPADVRAMPVEERLQLIGLLWDSLVEDTDIDQLVPEWHTDVLAERIKAFEAGTETTYDLEEAIEQIRGQLIRR